MKTGQDAQPPLPGLDWPPGFEALDEDERKRLAALIHEAHARERESLRRALERALQYLPALLRLPVRRILFPEGRP
jgi:hypothetical protein